MNTHIYTNFKGEKLRKFESSDKLILAQEKLKDAIKTYRLINHIVNNPASTRAIQSSRIQFREKNSRLAREEAKVADLEQSTKS